MNYELRIMNKKFQGVVVPMVTPLTKDLKIDVAAVDTIMAAFAENNISPLVLGTTGESASVGLAEGAVFVEAAVKAKQNHQVIYAGVVGNIVAENIERAKRYAAAGADVIVSTLPSYYTLTPAQMEKYYTQLAEACPCPVMMYNIKATTYMSIPQEVVDTMSQHPNIVGLKDSERDIRRMEIFANRYRNRPDFSFFCGCAALSLESMKMGADGIVPSAGNVVPEMYKTFYDALMRQDYTLALEMQEATDRVGEVYQQGFTLGESLAALKILMERRGFCRPYMMPPLTELPADKVDEIQIHSC
jgi:4-hydroxy-tetrahydrodipicolinate synthase